MVRKRRRRERSGAATPGTPSSALHPSPTPREGPLPRPLARIAGAGLALLTAGFAASLVADALGGGLAPVDVAARFVAAGALAAVAVALAALSLAPRAIRSLLSRSGR